MPSRLSRCARSNQEGAITILVALMLLVLLTIASLGMSRNSMREIVSSGFARQGSMARNTADSGIHWAIHWMDYKNSALASGEAQTLNARKQQLLLDPTLAGVAKDVISGADYAPGGTVASGFTLPSPTGTTQGFTMGITQMGKLAMVNTSQGVGAGDFKPAAGGTNLTAPDLWAIRSDAQVVQGGVTFVHAKEVWITTPVF